MMFVICALKILYCTKNAYTSAESRVAFFVHVASIGLATYTKRNRNYLAVVW